MKYSADYRTVLFGCVILLLSACGSGGDSESTNNGTSSSTPSSSSSGGASGFTVSANFVKGPVTGAECQLFEVAMDGSQGSELSSGTTENGVVNFENITYTGTTLVVCSGGTYTDEATGESRTAPTMRSVVDIDGDGQVTVSPLTELAVDAAQGNLLNVDNEAVAQAFGIEGIDITHVQPTDLNTQSAADDQAGQYGTVLGVVSQLQNDRGQALDALLENLAEELQDGALSEQDKLGLSDAADNLADSEVADAIDSDMLTGIVEQIQQVVDDTAPSIGFSPGSLSMEYGANANVSLTVVDGHLMDEVMCENGVTYSNGVITSDNQLGEFSCSATAIDGNQNTSSASLTVIVEDTTAPEITAPESVSFLSGDVGQATITAQDAVDGNINFIMQCSGANALVYEGAFYSQTPGNYTCTVSAQDQQQNQATATITVTVLSETINNAPVANAGSDFTAPTGSLVALDGTGSTDTDADSLTYSWTFSSRPQGSNASLSNAGSASADFVPDMDGAYIITLSVSDGLDASEDEITVTAATGTWVMNENTEIAQYFDALVNVTSVSQVSVGQNQFYQVSSSGIPDYSVQLTQDDVDNLNSRPNAASDFVGGQTSAQAGDIIAFGEDIGYNITQQGCVLGYWPPGPACPSDQQRAANIPANPAPASADCETNVNTMGLMLNGTSIYNWSDGVTYNNQGIWHQLAPAFEIYDVDICSGHAQTAGDYHHHMWSPCLAALFNDNGQAHSPIYGYAADGYPVYGPWYGKNVLAKSAWIKRDYSNTTKGGCSDGQRSCLMADQYDLSQGTVTAGNAGPDINATVTSNSGNEFLVSSGYYYEDYYYDSALTALGGEYLDEHNGHDHDNLGYHYHTTVEEVDGDLVPAFPYNIGPTFYGNTPGGSVYTCSAPPQGSQP